MSKIIVIGSGFSGLSAATYLAAEGHEVHIYEKNETAGGRARQLTTPNGYVFDMGPSWYWMPDVFERFFNDFGYAVQDLYKLKLLDPSFDVVFEAGQAVSIPADFLSLCNLFEKYEAGSGDRLKKFMEDAQFKYEIGMKDLVYMPGHSIWEFTKRGLLTEIMRLQVFSSFSRHVRKYFSHPKLIALMEFPVLFLGAMPQETPALYSLMNYAGYKLGTWYPGGGFGKVIESMVYVANKNGVQFHFENPVDKIIVENNVATGIVANGIKISCDAVIASADYHHVENALLPATCRNYSEEYWSGKTFAPSSLIYYLGISKKIKSLQHHTLFFEEDLFTHSKEIYKHPQWPARPLFYACCPSKTDDTVAPAGHENLFLLMPIAPGLEDNEVLREKYFHIMIDRVQKHTGEDLLSHIDYKRSYCASNFIEDYHSYKGNAYGLANTLMQTAFLKPKMRNRKIKNLYYTGQLTAPGPGVPPSLVSGKVAALELLKHIKSTRNEVAF